LIIKEIFTPKRIDCFSNQRLLTLDHVSDEATMEPGEQDFILRQLRSRSFMAPKHHLVALKPFPNFPALKLPVLYLAKLMHGGELLIQYEEGFSYCKQKPLRSITWHRSITKILGMAWDFHIETSGGRQIGNPTSDAARFAQCVRFGTITFDGQRYSDPLGLYWRAPSEHLGRTLLQRLRSFLSEIDIDFATRDDGFSQFLSVMQTSAARRRESATGFAVLSHLSEGQTASDKAVSPLQSDDSLQDGIEGGPVYRFPSDLWLPLLEHGHVMNEEQSTSLARIDATGRAHAALLSLGVRQSTPLHFWVNDISFSAGGLATVTLRHPEEYFDTVAKKKRKHILLNMGLTPRKRTSDRSHAGWKNLKLEKGYTAPTAWLPGSRPLCSWILKDYIVNVRAPVMEKRRMLGLPDHPFLLVFTSHDPAKGQYLGDPYTRKAAIGSWKRAMGRLAVRYPDRDLRVKKDLGTTMHGVRHLMGFSCIEAGLSLSDVADVLHHRSPLSALIYVRRSSREISDALDKAANRGPSTSSEMAGDAETLRKLRMKSTTRGRR
jgi:hypothetical protein